MRILVEGKRIQVFVNGVQTVDYTKPAVYLSPIERPGRKIESGTFAMQCTDPKSKA